MWCQNKKIKIIKKKAAPSRKSESQVHLNVTSSLIKIDKDFRDSMSPQSVLSIHSKEPSIMSPLNPLKMKAPAPLNI